MTEMQEDFRNFYLQLLVLTLLRFLILKWKNEKKCYSLSPQGFKNIKFAALPISRMITYAKLMLCCQVVQGDCFMP